MLTTRTISIFLLSVVAAWGQESASVIDWLTQLQSIEARLRASSSAEAPEIQSELSALQREITAGSATQPGIEIDVASPSQSADRAQLLAYVTNFRQELEDVERNRPGGAFNLGRVAVNVTANALQVVTATALDEADYRQQNLMKTPDALNLVPGVSVQRIGARNERGVFIRGFDVRQAPVYLDGIPVYVPYDGYVDLDRFLTYDISEIQVAKGFTSPLYGPNAIGGAVNLVSKAPTKKVNLDMGTGYASGDQVHGFLNAGTKWDRFWVQGSFAWLSSDTFPISGSFNPVPFQTGQDRVNSYQTDNKGRIRVAYTPNQTDQYSFTYAKQNGEKGTPPYAGSDPGVQARFWRWPEWDKESFYFIGSKELGETSYLRVRLYYDRFDNLLYSYDDNTYSSITRPYAFISPYDDDTYGTTSEFGTRAFNRQNIKVSFYFKDDTHREGNLGQPVQSYRDQTYSFGFEDTIQISGRTSAILGFSADHLDVLNAENVVNGIPEPFPKNNVWAFNPQAGIFHTLTESSKLHFTYARKTRLPTIKDRYSFRMGRAIPNPFLREERSDNLEIGYSHILGLRTTMEINAFSSNVTNSTQAFFVEPNVFQNRNIGEARFLGGEVGFRSAIAAGFQVDANYTYLSRRNQSDPSVIMLDTPRHKIYAVGTYLLGDRFTLLGNFTYEGGRWNQNGAGRVLLASRYAVVGIGGTASLSRNAELQVGINNLVDRNYFLQEGYPEGGRNAYVNFRYRF